MREEAQRIVDDNTVKIGPYAAVTRGNARALLGDEKWERLKKDRVRFLGPTAETIYPWNIVDYMQEPQRGRTAGTAGTTSAVIKNQQLETNAMLETLLKDGKKRVKLGSFWVDTGTILIGEPCQLLASKGSPAPTFDDLFQRTFTNEHPQGQPVVALLDRKNKLDSALSLVVGCDGWYHVYLEEGRIVIELAARVDP